MRREVFRYCILIIDYSFGTTELSAAAELALTTEQKTISDLDKELMLLGKYRPTYEQAFFPGNIPVFLLPV